MLCLSRPDPWQDEWLTDFRREGRCHSRRGEQQLLGRKGCHRLHDWPCYDAGVPKRSVTWIAPTSWKRRDGCHDRPGALGLPSFNVGSADVTVGRSIWRTKIVTKFGPVWPKGECPLSPYRC